MTATTEPGQIAHLRVLRNAIDVHLQAQEGTYIRECPDCGADDAVRCLYWQRRERHPQHDYMPAYVWAERILRDNGLI